jgi:hypothetical protein
VPDHPRRLGLLGAGIDRVAGAVVPVVTRSVDADELIQRIDVDGVLDRIDVNALLDRIDVDRLLDRLDVDRLLDRVEVDAILDRVDVDRLLDRIDVNAVVQRVDIQALADRAHLGDLISQSTGQVAENTLDLLRRQLVGLDVVAIRFVNRVLRRDPASLPAGPSALVTFDEAP